MAEKVYDAAEVEARLTAELPRWTYSDGAIRRVYRTQNWKATLMVVNTVGHLAEVGWHHPEVTLSFDWVEVALFSHDAQGVTDRDFALATKIEDVVYWRPDQDDGPLTGTPRDPKFAYLKYDEL